MFLFPEWIVHIYTDDALVAPLAVSLLFYAAIFQYPDGLQMVAAGILRGYKDTRMPMLYMVISFWIIGMTLGYNLTFGQGMGPAGMWVGMIAGLTVAAVLMLRRFRHPASGLSGKVRRSDFNRDLRVPGTFVPGRRFVRCGPKAPVMPAPHRILSAPATGFHTG